MPICSVKKLEFLDALFSTKSAPNSFMICMAGSRSENCLSFDLSSVKKVKIIFRLLSLENNFYFIWELGKRVRET